MKKPEWLTAWASVAGVLVASVAVFVAICASRAALDETRKSNETNERAWMVADSAALGQALALVNFKNVGRSPATAIEVVVEGTVSVDSPETFNPDTMLYAAADAWNGNGDLGSVAGPDKVFSYTRPFASLESLNRAHTIHGRLYLFGELRYLDVFNKTRVTTFCLVEISARDFASCEHGNHLR